MKHPTPVNPHTLFLSPQDVASLVSRQGMVKTLQGMAACIEQDFLRWKNF